MNVLKGTGVAIITPFKKNLDVDYQSLGKLIDFIIDGGVQYVVTMGTTGETPVLTKEEKKEIIQFTFNHINGRVPVVVGIGGNNTKELIKEIESSDISAATAILSASPYYNKPTQEGLFQHYKLIAEASAKPIILYNVPGRTGRNIDSDTVIRLANEVENIVGIKEASGDMLQCMKILKERPQGFLIVSGDDALALPQMACGMDGLISVAANAYPKEITSIIQSCINQDFKSAKILNDQLMAAYDLMFEENNPAGIKAFLFEMKKIDNELRMPLVPVSDNLQNRIREFANQC